MKKFLLPFAILTTAWFMPLAASTTHAFGLQNSSVCIYVDQPENYQEEDHETLDSFFKDPQEDTRVCAFHYYDDEEFSTTNFSEVYAYTDWIYQQLFKDQKRSQESTRTTKNYAIRSFTSTDSSGHKTYCYMYIGVLPDDIVFTIISTNPHSLEAAIEDYNAFSQNITWKQ